jgi:hypothetical protein
MASRIGLYAASAVVIPGAVAVVVLLWKGSDDCPPR